MEAGREVYMADDIENLDKLRRIHEEDPELDGFTPDLITEFSEPTRENIFLDENVLIAIKDNKKKCSTAYFNVGDVYQSDSLGEDGRYYRKMNFEQTVDDMLLLLEEAITQDREIFYPANFTGWNKCEAYTALTDLLESHGTSVDIESLEFSSYPEDAGIAVEAMERDAVIVTYDADFTDDEDFVMQYVEEVCTPSQMYHTIKND